MSILKGYNILSDVCVCMAGPTIRRFIMSLGSSAQGPKNKTWW